MRDAKTNGLALKDTSKGWKIIVSSIAIHSALEWAHTTMDAGDLGRDKTFRKLKGLYFEKEATYRRRLY